jgi:hypothetical protein
MQAVRRGIKSAYQFDNAWTRTRERRCLRAGLHDVGAEGRVHMERGATPQAFWSLRSLHSTMYRSKIFELSIALCTTHHHAIVNGALAGEPAVRSRKEPRV